MEWFLILSAFVVGEISGMWLAAMMTTAKQTDEDNLPVRDQAIVARQRNWRAHAAPILLKARTIRLRTVEQ